MQGRYLRVTPLDSDGKPMSAGAIVQAGDVVGISFEGFEVKDRAQVQAEETVRDGAIAAWNGAQR